MRTFEFPRTVLCLCLLFILCAGSGAHSAEVPNMPEALAAQLEPDAVAVQWIRGTESARLGASQFGSAHASAADVGPDRSSFVVRFDGQIQLGRTALMLYDTAQTVTIARNPDCLREANPLAFFGNEHPSEREVLLFNAAYIVGHWLLARKLDELASQSTGWARARRVYQVLTFAGHGAAVANNVALGIRPFSNYSCVGREL